MALKAYPLNDTDYTAEDAQLYTATRTSGVYADNHFNISVTGADNNVTIKSGLGWMKLSTFQGIAVANTEDVTINAGVSDPSLPRIDAVVYAYDANANAPEIIIKRGKTSSNPTAPSVVRDDFRHELHLYHILRRPGATTITARDIIDLRMDSDYCGMMADSVTKIDMTAIKAMVDSVLSELKEKAELVDSDPLFVLNNRVNELVKSQGKGPSQVVNLEVQNIGDTATGTIESNGFHAIVVIKNATYSLSSRVIATIPDEFSPLMNMTIPEYSYDGHELKIVGNEIRIDASSPSGQGGVVGNMTFKFSFPLKAPYIPELSDVRIGYDGSEHKTAGEAVREQIGNTMEGIKSSVRSINGITPDENGNVNVEPEHYPDWSHLTWYVMGDSLTDRNSKNAQGVPFTNKYYYDFIQEKTGIQIKVDGIGGTGYKNNMNGTRKTFLERVQEAFPENEPTKNSDVDIVTIFGSGNDLSSTDFDYAKGAIWQTMSYLLQHRPGLRVIVVPPAPWKSTDTHDYTKWNELWKTYCDNLELCAFKCNHRYLSDMYDCPPYFPGMDGHMKKFFTTDPNGIHPNEEGHKALAPYFYNALLQELALKV
jgi:lysophospholipase L1-like esterase